MQWPSWFQSSIQERLDDITARIQFDPSMKRHRIEEKQAFEALFSRKDVMAEFANWEDKHHYRQALENERLYLQGMRDGAKLVMALLSDSYATANEQGSEKAEQSESERTENRGR